MDGQGEWGEERRDVHNGRLTASQVAANRSSAATSPAISSRIAQKSCNRLLCESLLQDFCQK